MQLDFGSSKNSLIQCLLSFTFPMIMNVHHGEVFHPTNGAHSSETHLGNSSKFLYPILFLLIVGYLSTKSNSLLVYSSNNPVYADSPLANDEVLIGLPYLKLSVVLQRISTFSEHKRKQIKKGKRAARCTKLPPSGCLDEPFKTTSRCSS